MRQPVCLLPLRLSLSLVLLGLSATAIHAQAPVVHVTVNPFTSPSVAAGNEFGIAVEATLAADAPDQATATVDPMGIGRSTFVVRLSPTTYAGIDPCPAGRQCFTGSLITDVRLAPGVHQLPVTVTDSQGRRTTVAAPFQVTAAEDRDHDGLPDAWETEFRMNSFSATGDDGAAGDPDGDGVSNLDEFKAGTNPREKYVRLFAEGSTGDAQPLTTCITVLAINQETPRAGPVRVVFTGDNGRRAEETTFATNYPTGVCPMVYAVGDRVVAIRVESEEPVAVERQITNGFVQGYPANYQLANASLGVQEPSRAWVFADGHTADGLDMFLLLYNPTSAPVTAQLTYVRAPSAVVARASRVLPPGVRTTIWVNQDQPEAVGSDVSVTIAADAGILAERAFRFQAPGRTVPHDSVTRGAWTAATHWYLPDMDSRGPFASSLVVMNPSATPTRVTITSQFPDRAPARVEIALTGGERRELTQRDLPVPPNVTFGVAIESSDGVGIVAERVASGATASGAWRRSAIGSTEPGTRWIFPSAGFLSVNDTDLVVLNVSDTTARVRIRMRNYGFECCDNSEAFVDVPPRGSLHVPMGTNDPARTIPTNLFGGSLVIDSVSYSGGTAAPIVVERTTYWDLDGVRHGRAASVIGNQVQ
jgi:hypothetical protein